MKGYKAFKKGLICKGKQYAENTVFEEETAEICKSGMHFCKNPLDVLDYYPLIDGGGNMSDFAEVEALDETHTDDEKKFCTKKLKIGAKLSLKEFIKASFTVAYENIKNDVAEATKDIEAGGYKSTLAGGDESTLAGGDESKLAGGYKSTLAGGYKSTLAGGYKSTLAGGDESTLAGGDESTLAGGNYSKLAGGNCSTLAGGDCALVVGDCGSVARGGKGSLIVIAERNEDGEIKSFGVAIVDGQKIKADTFYKMESGILKEFEGEA